MRMFNSRDVSSFMNFTCCSPKMEENQQSPGDRTRHFKSSISGSQRAPSRSLISLLTTKKLWNE